MILIRNILFRFVFYLSILLYFPTAIIALCVKNPKKFYWWTMWARFVVWWLKVCCGLDYRIKGRENIDESRSYVILPNHQSQWETITFQIVFPPFVYVLKKELLAIPVFGWALRLIGAIGIDRSKGREALRHIVTESEIVFKQQCSLLIFPEGTRQPYGTLKEFLPGGAFVAQKTGTPILPVAHNAGKFWPKSKLIIEPGTVDVIIGEPIETSGKSVRVIQQESKDAIVKLIEEIERGTEGRTHRD